MAARDSTGRFGFTPGEMRTLRGLSTPSRIQRFLDGMPYNPQHTAWSPRQVLRERTAHCLEAAVFAAAALRVLGFPPLLLDLEAVRDTDHVLAIFKMRGHWGAIAKSNWAGLRYREPVYRTLRELAMSYFEDYYNLAGERTLRAYSRPVNLARFDARRWMTTEEDVWFIPEHLVHIPHRPLVTAAQLKAFTRLDRRSKQAGLWGYKEKET